MAPASAPTGAGDYICPYCQAHFSSAQANQAATGPDTARAPDAAAAAHGQDPRGPRIAIVIWAALTLLVLVGGVASLIGGGYPAASEIEAPPDALPAMQSGEREPGDPPPRQLAPAVQAATPPIEPQAELRNVGHGRTSIGGAYWLADYANVGEIAIERPRVSLSLFDASGARVGEQSGHARRDYLAPGMSTVILVLSSQPPAYERFELRPVQPRAARRSGETSLPVTEFRIVDERFGRQLVGTVKNDTEAALRFVRILAVGRSAEGAPVSMADTYIGERTLAAGASSGFHMRLGTFELSAPASWEVSAAGRP